MAKRKDWTNKFGVKDKTKEEKRAYEAQELMFDISNQIRESAHSSICRCTYSYIPAFSVSLWALKASDLEVAEAYAMNLAFDEERELRKVAGEAEQSKNTGRL